MSQVITISIDVTKLDKTRFKRVTKQNGQNAVYADIVLIPRPDDRGNDYMVVQGVTKEEREQNIRGPILGNGKIMGGKKQEAKIQRPAQGTGQEDDGSGVPF